MNPEPKFDPTRRSFFRQACCAAVGATGMLSTLSQLRLIGASAADSMGGGAGPAAAGDYKALVCLFLQGGNDTNNVIIPYDTSGYQSYSAARTILALPQSQLLPISPARYSDGRSWALHPSFTEVQSLFAQRRLAILANTGTLVQPTTLSQYRTGANLPPQLFSHIDQQTQWQSSVPDKPFTSGWGGRLADLVNAMNTNNQISMSISLTGNNSFQVGQTVSQYAVNPNGAILLTGSTGSANSQAGLRYKAQTDLLSLQEASLFQTAFGGMTGKSINDSQVLTSALASAATLKTVFPATSTASQLNMIARLISAGPSLGLRRQVFFAQLGGWDLHASELIDHPTLLSEISQAMNAFYAATVELGVANQVTTFTASDFSRTYNTNGDGSDHGWGSHHLIMGGAVNGGDIYGAMPSLAIGGNDDTGRGRWIPSTSVDQYSATLASWFGVTASNLPAVLPNLGRFANADLGFMAGS
jgi:uncharacterized protein (DUF1501 family)